MSASPWRALPADERLYHLYEISKLLTRFDGVEQTLPEVVAIAAHALPVRSAVLLVADRDGVRSYVWKTDDVDARALSAALVRARRTHAYLAGAATHVGPVREEDEPPTSVQDLPRIARGGRCALSESRFVLLPLVVERHRIFGALQFEGMSVLDEADVVFVSAVSNQVAVAIDRKLRTDQARALTQRAREAAEAAEARARAQLELTRALTGSLGEGIVAVDTECRVTFMNPAAEDLLVVAERDALGRLATDLLRVQRQDGIALREDENPLVVVLRSGRGRRSDDHAFIGRDAVAVPFSYTCNPIREDGRLVGAVVAFHDVLAVKRSEQMQRFLADMSCALGASLDHRATLDALVRCSVPSFADLCAIDEVEPGSPAVRTVSGPAAGTTEDASSSLEAVATRVTEAALATGAPLLVDDLPAEAQPLPDDGAKAPRTGSAIVVPLRLRGRTLGVLTFVVGRSGRRYTRADLPFAAEIAQRAATAIDNARRHEQSEAGVRERQDILAMVSHDLRTPLNIVLVAAASLLDRLSDRERMLDGARKLDMIRRAAERMVRMTTDLLDVASIEAGHLSVQARSTDLGALLRDVLDGEQWLAARRNLRIELALAEQPIIVMCDRERIQQVLENFVGNAIKFTQPGGRIVVSTLVCGDLVRVEVRDTGRGVSADLLPRLFERYRQAAETAASGRGLGLFISRGIIEAHGGTVEATSKEGVGSTFAFTLPLSPP